MFIKLETVCRKKLADLTAFMLDKNHQIQGPNGEYPFAKIKSASVPEKNSNGNYYNVTLDVTTSYFKKTDGDIGHNQVLADSKHMVALWEILTKNYKD